MHRERTRRRHPVRNAAPVAAHALPCACPARLRRPLSAPRKKADTRQRSALGEEHMESTQQADVLDRNFRFGLPNRADALSTSFAASYAGIMAFMAVASEGSFAKAGERLGIGRSAVSRNVQKLETQLSTDSSCAPHARHSSRAKVSASSRTATRASRIS
ncbi:hypothetical protein CBM2634_B170189 [Cupriavidus taiwanensis]|uniref:HTH lysR-type domain-containing protein n=1 Tax=Cupriavidus taiwanensis TaxID=164546 RepID=A0A375J803_9BURK|nr:hypothetical protein CBM2634_B170189 [Cupriavidus taiwanensis]